MVKKEESDPAYTVTENDNTWYDTGFEKIIQTETGKEKDDVTEEFFYPTDSRTQG